MAVSQSDTMWVKKGTVVNGKKVKKGYVAQKGKPGKRVTNKIKLVVDTDKRGKAGDTVQTKKGRYVKSSKNKIKVEKPKSKGGGYTGNGPAGGRTVVKTSAPPPKQKDKPKGRTDAPKDTTKKDTGYENKGDRKSTSATVSSAVSEDRRIKNPKTPQLGGKNKKYTPGREEPGQTKGNAKPKSRIDKIGSRGPHGTAADAVKATGKGVSTFMEKYGPNGTAFDNGKSKKVIKIGTVVTRGNPPKKYRKTKNGWMLVK